MGSPAAVRHHILYSSLCPFICKSAFAYLSFSRSPSMLYPINQSLKHHVDGRSFMNGIVCCFLCTIVLEVIFMVYEIRFQTKAPRVFDDFECKEFPCSRVGIIMIKRIKQLIGVVMIPNQHSCSSQLFVCIPYAKHADNPLLCRFFCHHEQRLTSIIHFGFFLKLRKLMKAEEFL